MAIVADSFTSSKRENETIILDFAECREIGDINSMLKDNFVLPEGFSKDWVKMWGYLEKSFGKNRKMRVELHSFFRISDELRKKCRFLLEIFESVQNNSDGFSYDFVF